MKNTYLALTAALLTTAALFTCEPVPDFCGTGEIYDPSCEFCHGSRAYPMCVNDKGKTYNPLIQGCLEETGRVGTKCADHTVVPAGTPCGGYTLTTAVTPADAGKLDPAPDKTKFKAGDPLYLNAVPTDTNYVFAGWGGTITSQENGQTYTMTGTNPQVLAVAMFKPKAAGKLITDVFPGGAGTVTRDPDKETYAPGERVTLTATAAEGSGFVFDGWSGTGASDDAGNLLTVAMDSSKAIVAIFTPATRALRAAVSPANGGAVFINNSPAASGGGSQAVGATVTVLAIADAGFQFSRWIWEGDAEFDNPDEKFATVTVGTGAQVTTITAVFTQGGGGSIDQTVPPMTSPGTPTAFTVTVASEGAGATGGGDYTPGAAVTVTAGTAPTGRQFKEWTSSPTGVIFVPSANSPTVMFSMPSSAVTVTAAFEPIPTVPTYTVTVISDGTGATPSGNNHAAGDTVRITAGTAQPGHQFKVWTSSVTGLTFDPSADNATVKFIMPNNAVTVTANFEAIVITATTKTIAFNPGSDGTVSPTSRVTDTSGKLANLPVPDKRGYTFGGWFNTSADTGGTRVDTGTVFSADATIYARWTITTYTIIYNLDGGTEPTPPNPSSYTVDTDFTLRPPTKSNYTFEGWTGTGLPEMTKSVTVPAGSTDDRTYIANWLPAAPAVTKTYMLMFASHPAGGGTTTPSEPKYNVSAGDKFEISATPSEGYKFTRWSTDLGVGGYASDISAATTFTMPGNMPTSATALTVTANFEATAPPPVYTEYVKVAYKAGFGGTLLVSDSRRIGPATIVLVSEASDSLAPGDSISVTAVPNEGYVFFRWSDGMTAAMRTDKYAGGGLSVEAIFNAIVPTIPSDEFVTIGGKKWMKKNLNIETEDSWCYQNSPDSCAKYGRLYTWEAAMTACPNGWKLPDTADWRRLVEAAGGYETAGKKLKSASGWNGSGNGTDTHGFSALPGGGRNSDGTFGSAGYGGNWWTATEGGSDLAYYRGMDYGSGYVGEHNGFKDYAFSVRCVGD